MTEVRISNEAVPPVLNKAEVEWISLYVGRKTFHGGDNIQSNYVVDDKVDFDVHLYKLREMEDNPVLERMTQAYDADYAFTRLPDGYRVINLNRLESIALFSKNGDVIETSMCDIETIIALKYFEKNRKFIDD